MAISKIQQGDQVKIIAGNYKGQAGVVSEIVLTKKGKITKKRLVVSSVPTIVKYKKGNKLAQMPGEQLSQTRTIDASNVMLANDKGEITRSKVQTIDGKKSRVAVKGGSVIVKTVSKKAKKASPDTKEIK
jgi:large subunit ribosomal protein L24